MPRYYIERRRRKYVKRYVFLSFVRNSSDKYRKNVLDTAATSRLDAAENISQSIKQL